MFKRISKREAKKLFSEGNKVIYLCPCKMYPSNPWNMACAISGKEYLERAEMYRNHETLWKGTKEETAWQLMYNDWAFYNTSYETGYYAHYYEQSNV